MSQSKDLIEKQKNMQKLQKEILQNLHASESLSHETITELKKQDEQIGRIETISNDINQELNVSSKILKQMTGFFSPFYHALFGKSDTAENQPQQQSQTESQSKTTIFSKITEVKKEIPEQRNKTNSNDQISDNNQFLDMVQSQMKRIEDNAKTQNTMLKDQLSKLTPLTYKIEDNDRKTRDLIKKTEKIM
jgi:hypothetical protein